MRTEREVYNQTGSITGKLSRLVEYVSEYSKPSTTAGKRGDISVIY